MTYLDDEPLKWPEGWGVRAHARLQIAINTLPGRYINQPSVDDAARIIPALARNYTPVEVGLWVAQRWPGISEPHAVDKVVTNLIAASIAYRPPQPQG